MDYAINLICGDGYVVDWTAISAVATAVAVIVALWVPAMDRRTRRRERLEAEARASEAISLSLQTVLEIFPKVVDEIKNTNGALIDAPGTNFLYGIEGCHEIIEREALCYQLPKSYMALGLLVSSFARKWCNEIDVRIQTQRNEELKRIIDWREHKFTCHLGEQLHAHATTLRNECAKTRVAYEKSQTPRIVRMYNFCKISLKNENGGRQA